MIGRVLDERYELVEYIGGGGMALVYRAIDRRTGHSVAVKVLRPEYSKDQEYLSRFEREATAASKMSHHNIVNLLDLGQDKDCRYLVMEYVRGKTLKDVISQKGALPPDIATQIAIRILSALQHAHKNGVIHRDIKPQNILVHSEGHIKVADFGIARVAGSNTISRTDSVMGSVYYFSPEQASGEDVTFASDIYSVGVVLYEMLTGAPPFDGETPVAVALQHINAKPKPLREINPDITPALERVVVKAMEKKPEMRYQSTLEMAQDLHRALYDPDGDWLNRLQDKPIPQISENAHTAPVQVIKRRGDSRTAMIVGMIVLSVAVLLGLHVGGRYIYNVVVNSTKAPYVIDEYEEEAIKLIKRASLNYEISRVSNPDKPTGTVILQSPEFDTLMRRGDTIYLTISTGAEQQAAPKLIGMDVEAARAEGERYGFTVLALPKRAVSTRPWGTVLTQSPESDALLSVGSIIQVTLSGGCVTLPELTGKTSDEAMLMIEQLGLNLIEIKEIVVSDSTQFGRVAAQEYTKDNVVYRVGEQVTQDTQVTLAVYVSQEDVTAPESTASVPPEGGT